MKKNYVHLGLVIDESGSMSSIKEPTVAAFNTFIQDQKKVPGEATFTLVKFSTNVETMYNFGPLNDAPVLNENNYRPDGWTALLDGIGKTINLVGEKLALMSESDRPDRVIISIFSDGLENKSKSFTSSKIREMITHQREKYNWQFNFLGTTEESMFAAESYGIGKLNRILYQADALYVGPAMASTSSLVSLQRCCDANNLASVGYTDEDRKKQENLV